MITAPVADATPAARSRLARRDDLTVGYMISRGLAKAGTRQPEDEDNS